MVRTSARTGEAARLETLWAGAFGNAYVDRNLSVGNARGELWLPLMDELDPDTVLEVGCGVGANLQWITQRVDANRVTGADINAKALRLLDRRVPGVRGVNAPARELPLADRSVEFVLSMGLLMHQPRETLDKVMSEMVRVSRRYVFCGEYCETETVEDAYCGEERALFRRDYAALLLDLFPYDLALIRQGRLRPDEGWDVVTWWLFERA
jgi:ubiquinone/menaquinone biosynthesis C-methylase UbiE